MNSAWLSFALLFLCTATPKVVGSTAQESEAVDPAVGNVSTTSQISGTKLLSRPDFLKVLVLFFDQTGKFMCEGIKITKTGVLVEKRCSDLVLSILGSVRATIGLDIADACKAGVKLYSPFLMSFSNSQCGSSSFTAVQLVMDSTDPKINDVATVPLGADCSCLPSQFTIYDADQLECNEYYEGLGRHDQATLNRVSLASGCGMATSVLMNQCIGIFGGLFHPTASVPFLLGLPVLDFNFAMQMGPFCTPEFISFISLSNPAAITELQTVLGRLEGSESLTQTSACDSLCLP